MNDRTKSGPKQPATGTNSRMSGPVLGLRAFEKISAVEGIVLTRQMRLDLAHVEEADMDERQRSRFIIEKYGKP